MEVTHFASHEQVEALFKVFAVAREVEGDLDWIAPAWWYLMYATAVR